MRLLLDSCVWGPAKNQLIEAGHDVHWVGEWDRDPGDEEILRHSTRERRALVTLDKDFRELAVVQGLAHAGIIRLVGFSARNQGLACLQALERFELEILGGALIPVTPTRIRVRPGSENKP